MIESVWNDYVFYVIKRITISMNAIFYHCIVTLDNDIYFGYVDIVCSFIGKGNSG